MKEKEFDLRTKKTWWRWGISALILVVLVVIGYGVLVGWSLIHPARDRLNSNPRLWGMSYRTIRIASPRDHHLRLHGWWIPAPNPSGATVVMAHGYGSNRLENGVPAMAVAHALNQMGVNVLTFDFRGEGRSPGSYVTVGSLEQWDLLAAVQKAHRLAPASRLVLLGYSMGASTAILTAAHTSLVSGVIADSPFANLRQYLMDNLPVWTHLPAFPFNNIILGILPRITGVKLRQSDPLAVISKMGSRPILLIAGLADHTILSRNSVRLYHAVRPTDVHASLWLVPHAGHIQAFKVEPIAYLQHVYRFIKAIDPTVRMPPTSYGF